MSELLEEIHEERLESGEFAPQFFAKWCTGFANESLSVASDEWQTADLHLVRRGINVRLWNYNVEIAKLSIVVVDYSGEVESAGVLTTGELRGLVQNAGRLMSSRNRGFLIKSVDPANPSYPLIDTLRVLDEPFQVNQLEVVVFSSKRQNDNLRAIQDLKFDGVNELKIDLWDLNRLESLESSETGHELLEINLDDYGAKVGALKAFDEARPSAIESYLIVFPGRVLADIYEKHGERLLEQNVRTFLQFAGKVNRGMKETIKNEPDHFFAYNNGITATAEAVTFDGDGNIQTLTNLQIVNGGQTSAAIFSSRKKEGLDLSRVFVQMKLSITGPELMEEIVPKISEYSNTQNKVNSADFFSNHPFHREIERLSRAILVPRKHNVLHDEKWFYERSRGQYKNGINLAPTPAQKRAYEKLYPKSQVFTKTDMAKYYLSYNGFPHEVSLGAQGAFAGKGTGAKKYLGFVNRVIPIWDCEETRHTIDEKWYKELVAMAIIFKSVDKSIARAPWYNGYKAVLVTYSIAKYIEKLSSSSKSILLVDIWKDQEVAVDHLRQILVIAETVNNYFQNVHDGRTTLNIAMWAREPKCWAAVAAL